MDEIIKITVLKKKVR